MVLKLAFGLAAITSLCTPALAPAPFSVEGALRLGPLLIQYKRMVTGLLLLSHRASRPVG